MKKLCKSETDKMLCGVCGGFAEYFNVDATLIRLALVIFCLVGGSGLLAYFIAAIIMPNPENNVMYEDRPYEEKTYEDYSSTDHK